MTEQLLTLREVMDTVKLSKPTIYRQMADGAFPRAIRWRLSDVSAWLEGLSA